MVDLCTWGTPHGRKVSIMLEELDLEYNVHEINIGQRLAVQKGTAVPCLN